MTAPSEDRGRRLRALPSVDRLAASVARAELATRRAELLGGETGEVDLVQRAAGRLRPSLRRVLNATGVVLHTNLGRAPLAAEARMAVARAAAGYCNLELDLDEGGRGNRQAHVEGVLREVTGAEAGLVVNNCAAAVLLALAAVVSGGEVAISRGQLIEIGGGFRIPEVLAQAGATLVEVGTTNRTRIGDYERAIAGGAVAVMRAHQSNFRMLGFVQETEIEDLARLPVPVIDDIGSGALAELPVLSEEPSVRRSLRAGAALVTFSGDKLLGGPQAGIILGSADAVAACRSHPLARALRIDKLSLAALEATLALYRDPDHARRAIPVLQMLDLDADALHARARRLADATGGRIVTATSRVGGGALPLLELAGPVVELDGGGRLAAALRDGDPPVLGRVRDECVLLDPRTLAEDEIALVGDAMAAIRR